MDQNSTHACSTDQTIALQEALTCLLNILETHQVNYALLHPGDNEHPDVSSDIDIILDNHPDKTIVPALHKLDATHGTVWTQKLHYDTPHGYYYVVQVPCNDGFAYLQLDCLHDPYGINRYHLSSTYLLQGKLKNGRFSRVSPEAEALYLLIKRSLKKNATPENITEIATVVTTSNSLQKQMRSWLGKPLTNDIIRYCKHMQYSDLANLLNSSKAVIEDHFRLHHPFLWLFKNMTTAVRQCKRVFRPSGLFIVLIGPDGCGKTTISTALRNDMKRNFRAVWRFHWRPKLLPKLGGSGNNSDSNSQSDNNAPPTPPDKAKYNQLVSMVRFCYYLTDFVFGYWLVIYPKKARSTFIVGERYFADILVHPVRYGFNLPGWFMRACTAFVPKPDAIVLLSGDAQRIHNRKPELDVTTISEQLKQYSSEIVHWGEHFTADTNQPVDDVIKQIQEFFGEVLHRRITNKRVNTLLAYPRRGRTRLLLDPFLSRENLSKLYNPSSLAGRLSLLPLKALPHPFRLLSAKYNRTVYYNTFRRAEADKIIKQHFSEQESVRISYYMGNGGPRTKITAQVTSNGNVIAYVKIANTQLAKGLLTNEQQSLIAIHSSLDNVAPEVITKFTHNGSDYLFTSAPPNNYKKSNHKLTKSHFVLAEAIFNSTKDTVSIRSYLDHYKLPKRINNIQNTAELKRTSIACSDAITLLYDCFAHAPVVTGRKHGDFCPWNILSTPSGDLYIFDWEYSEADSAALSDFIHFIRSLCHHVYRYSPEQTAEHILRNQELHRLAERVDIPVEQIPGYVIIYLIHEILRHAETRSTSISTHQEQVKQASFLGACLHSVSTTIRHGAIPRRVCVAAYACEPEKGSEPGVGWNWVKLISKKNHTWVFTKYNNSEPIENYLAEHPDLNLNFIYVDVPNWLTFWKKGQRGVRTYYYLWQFFALYKCRKLHKSVNFDLAHHVSFVNDWLWSFAALVPAPFIWGPIGSHPSIPRQLLPHNRALLSEITRLGIQSGMRLIDPLYWMTVIRARKIIAINKEITEHFPISMLAKNKVVIESAIAHSQADNPARCKKSENFDVLYVGRFHHTKCPHLAIEAFQKAHSKIPGSRLILVGRGPEEKYLKSLAEAGKSKNDIIFHSWRTQHEVLKLMAGSSVFLFPSTEGGGMVVIEAMSLGLPVISLDYGGPGSMVTDNTGYRVSVTDKDSVVERLGNALIDYYNNPDKLSRHSANAVEHAMKTLSWESKHERIEILYNELHKPDNSVNAKNKEQN